MQLIVIDVGTMSDRAAAQLCTLIDALPCKCMSADELPSLDDATALLRLEDRFGWDDVFRLPDGRIVIEDRNTDCNTVSARALTDAEAQAFIEAIQTIARSDHH